MLTSGPLHGNLDSSAQTLKEVDQISQQVENIFQSYAPVLAPARAIIFCNQRDMVSRQLVEQLQSQVTSSRTFLETFGCLSLRGYQQAKWGLLATVLTARIPSGTSTGPKGLVRIWLELESLHDFNDLALFSSDHPSVLIASSPWISRPLGRQLPSVKSICGCERPADAVSEREWKVHYSATAAKLASSNRNIVWDCS
ncbi:hypothetical protein FS749_006077 [Ceratobasidium sp. UAMH 11750]|nr:hypothetical protein FS749_006077 [Ceratobasidium sp. UAMH 11750]